MLPLIASSDKVLKDEAEHLRVSKLLQEINVFLRVTGKLTDLICKTLKIVDLVGVFDVT